MILPSIAAALLYLRQRQHESARGSTRRRRALQARATERDDHGKGRLEKTRGLSCTLPLASSRTIEGQLKDSNEGLGRPRKEMKCGFILPVVVFPRRGVGSREGFPGFLGGS